MLGYTFHLDLQLILHPVPQRKEYKPSVWIKFSKHPIQICAWSQQQACVPDRIQGQADQWTCSICQVIHEYEVICRGCNKLTDVGTVDVALSCRWTAAPLMVLPPEQAAKLSHCGCDISWFCSPHDACFIHESCLCEGSSHWPSVKLVHSDWVSFSCAWLADMICRPLLPPS